MSQHVRIRCPLCGFLGTQSRLDQDHQFELIIQSTTSRGRGKITNEYYSPENTDGFWLLKLALIEKMEAVIANLKQELRDEKDEIWREHFYAGEYAEARQVSSTYHADFSDMVANVDTLQGQVVYVVKIPAKVASESPLSRQLAGLVGRSFTQRGGIQSEQDDGVIVEEVSGAELFTGAVGGGSDSGFVRDVVGKSKSRKGNDDENYTQESVGSKLVD